MIIIFLGSNDSGSGDKSRFLTHFILTITGFFTSHKATTEEIELIIFVLRKMAHIIEYFILAISYFYALNNTYKKNSLKKTYTISFILTFLYAITDELHQSFVPNRVGTYHDVLIDSIGILSGYLLIYSIYKVKTNN